MSRLSSSAKPSVRRNKSSLLNLAHPLDLGEGRRIRSTTVICVRRGDSVVMAADGQVSIGRDGDEGVGEEDSQAL